ncbi:MAG TPA: hypothetical protein VFG04_13075 [Planctomycetaceae bacterium]|jgi:hypothetical protein|nr:hypothetical protein [Planctomycetaceae bacterium]
MIFNRSTSQTPIQVAWFRCAVLALTTGALWLLLVAPAWFIGGREGLIGLSAAAVLCVVPGLIVFWFAAAYGAAGGQVPLVVLGGMILRMIFVFLGLLIIQSADPRLGFREFVVWLLAFYTVLLGVETFLVMPRSGSSSGQPHAGGV